MAYQPINSNQDFKKLIGEFIEKSGGKKFEYQMLAQLDEQMFNYNNGNYPHAVWVSSNPVNDCGYRAARVLKTVVYVVVDEDESGNPVVEKWSISNHTVYSR